jgi:voltage-gated potassium channel
VRPDTRSPLRRRLYEIIFETDTPAGRRFDVGLIIAIVASVVVVMLDSVGTIRALHGETFRLVEWGFTLLFTVEYALRLWVSPRPLRYARSFFGLVDLLAILPTYLSVILPGSQFFVVIRVLRVIRVFRVLKLVHFVGEGAMLAAALRASRHKISVFLVAVLCSVVIIGALMFLIEGADAGFTSIPAGVYWAIVTLTTVGYGDIAPQTPVGQMLAGLVMILGYGIIAVPTGIVTVELGRETERVRARLAGSAVVVDPPPCPSCGARGHTDDALYCRRCGTSLGR